MKKGGEGETPFMYVKPASKSLRATTYNLNNQVQITFQLRLNPSNHHLYLRHDISILSTTIILMFLHVRTIIGLIKGHKRITIVSSAQQILICCRKFFSLNNELH